MKAGLFVPCYIDQLYPDVGIATVDVLERLGIDVDVPDGQTCCGQPLSNSGCAADARPLARRFADMFRAHDVVVVPSGSCVATIRHHHAAHFDDPAAHAKLVGKTFELCELLVDVLGVGAPGGPSLGVRFPHRVGLHQSCHGLRELRLGRSSERMLPAFNKVERVLAAVDGLTLASLQRPDECCGFGGTFAVAEEQVSCLMGLDRIADHEGGGAEVMTAVDMSCLMHLDGLIRRRKKPMRVLHVAQILAGRTLADAAAGASP